MPELPRLDDLVRLADVGTDDTDGVLDGDPLDRSVHEGLYEAQRLGLLLALSLEPARPRDRQMRAGRMGHHEIPYVAQSDKVPTVTLNMGTVARIARQIIHGCCVMASSNEGIAHYSREFAGD